MTTTDGLVSKVFPFASELNKSGFHSLQEKEKKIDLT